MLYIKKGSPPPEMIRKVNDIKRSPEWKRMQQGDTKAIRAAFDELPKDKIRQTLLKEQHYLCAYCMRQISDNGISTTIEHFTPLSKDKDKALDYNNMLAVCDGGRNWDGEGKRILCCDAWKSDDDELTISPLNRMQMELIAYSRDGFIKTQPKNETIDTELRDKLRLNGVWKDNCFQVDTSTNLVKERKDTYEIYDNFVRKLDKKGKCTSVQIKKIIDQIESAPQRQKYAGVLLYFFKKKYQSLLKRGK